MNPEIDVFADTVFWIALMNDRDQYHAEAVNRFKQLTGRIITSHPVLVEFANHLSKPPARESVARFIEALRQREDCLILFPTEHAWEQSWQIYKQSSDKSWSYTDCCSFVLMREQGLTRALTADQHFRQAGFEVLL